jgi:3-hydroxyacyl-CoA dehydrogenase
MVSVDKPIRRVAVVGTGVTGASWAAPYLARGLDVVATVPAPNAEVNLRNYAFLPRRQGRGSDAARTGSA